MADRLKQAPEREEPTKEIDLGHGVKVTIGVLSAADSFICDDIIGASASDNKSRKVYALCSIRRYNGVQMHPLEDENQYDRVLRKFDGPRGLVQLNKLTAEFLKFMAELADNEIKDAVDESEAA